MEILHILIVIERYSPYHIYHIARTTTVSFDIVSPPNYLSSIDDSK